MNELNTTQTLFKQLSRIVLPVIREQGSFSLMQFYLLTLMPLKDVISLSELTGLNLPRIRWSLNNLRRLNLIEITKAGIPNSPDLRLRCNTYDLSAQGRPLFRHIFRATNQPTATNPCTTPTTATKH